MVDSIPTSYNIEQITSLKKLFDTWFETAIDEKKRKKRMAQKKFIRERMGWIAFAFSLIKPVFDGLKALQQFFNW